MGRPFMDMIGKKYGWLTVIDQYKDKCGKRDAYYCICRCQCGNIKKVLADNLRSGGTVSCGCWNRQNHQKRNKYDLSGEYGVGWTTNTNKEFYFDLEDFDKIKNYSWHENKDGYIRTTYPKDTSLFMHRLVMNAPDDMVVDHKKHKLYDNRKSELRLCTNSENQMNANISKNNTSGHTGVFYHKNRDGWVASIGIDNEVIYLGIYHNIEDAISARREAEEKYFKDKSFKNSVGYYNNEINNEMEENI